MIKKKIAKKLSKKKIKSYKMLKKKKGAKCYC